MKTYRTFAAILYLSGVFSLLLGVEGISRAQPCIEEETAPALCVRAHTKEPFENGSGEYCDWFGNECKAMAGTDCVDRWGFAIPGDCRFEAIGTTDPHVCFNHSLLTLVNLYWYTAKCKQTGGNCDCKWEMTSTSHPVQLCDCYDIDDD